MTEGNDGLGSATTISTALPPHTAAQRRQSMAASTIADTMTVAPVTVAQGQPQTPGGGWRSQLSLLEASDPNLAGLSMKERRMAQRRCIAEDPEWNLALVEKLTDLCVKVIVANFEQNSILNGIPNKYRERVLESISITLPLRIAAPLIPDESYWKRRSLANFKNCDIRKHGDSWKRLFFELHVQALAESFIPKKLGGLDEIEALEKELKVASPFVECLHLRQMKPTEAEEGTVVKATDPPPDHIDVNLFFHNLSNLKSIQLYYGNADLSHNKIGDSGARGIAKLLCSETTNLKYLNIANNKISRAGAQALGKALQQNQVLEELNVRMNGLGDSGGAMLMAGLAKGVSPGLSKLRLLDISSNGLAADSVTVLCALLKRNGKHLSTIDLSCNKLGNFGTLPGGVPMGAAAPAASGPVQNGTGRPGSAGRVDSDMAGKMLFEAISHNKYVTHLDIRVTDLSQEYMIAIKGIVTENSQ
ncbi:T-complex-associated testis-expressed protein 1 [Dinochytrium kinnereticum]|nr:T-complex-associated testis-expressed protein 1 [Dinochytrium kinnereticum]